MRRLVEYWADGYDWRWQEQAINRLPHGFVEIAGIKMHYLRFAADPGDEPRPPLLLGNGWPSTFLELVAVAQQLAERGFTVVVPSLPGFTFSEPRPHLTGSPPTYELWHSLMRDELGFERYGVHGGDLSSGHARWLAQAHPESVTGLHLLDVDNSRRDDDTHLTDEELDFLAAEQDWQTREGAYSHQQRTRPLTLARAQRLAQRAARMDAGEVPGLERRRR